MSGELQEALNLVESQLAKLRTGLRTNELTLRDLFTSNQGHLRVIEGQNSTIRGLENANKACEEQKKFQLGNFNTVTLLLDFVNQAGAWPESGAFDGKFNGEPVKGHITVLRTRGEVLLLMKNIHDNYVIWQGKMTDCTLFYYSWRYWIRLGKALPGRPLYVSLSCTEGLLCWLHPSLTECSLMGPEKESFIEERRKWDDV